MLIGFLWLLPLDCTSCAELISCTAMLTILLFCLLAAAPAAADSARFVTVPGGVMPGRSEIRLDSFDMAVHPVTNREYHDFIKATGHPAPLHWGNSDIPSGTGGHPVVFVNRYDVAAYLEWRSEKESRVYRLPTRSEFEYAARAGSSDARYPWGGTLPNNVNFDVSAVRTFADWKQHIQPAGQTPENAFGLRDMAGNVWQMVDTYPDLATNRWVYRVTNRIDREGDLAGGSWARGEYYLRCGVFGRSSPGIRHPDIGFRLVREPEGSTHFQRMSRRLVALPSPEGVFLSWQFLPEDIPATGFHVYRSTRRDAAGIQITKKPLTGATNYTDPNPAAAQRIYYRVRAVRDGKLGAPSEWAGVEPGEKPTGLVMRIEPTPRQSGAVPVFGDLDGDGVLDVVVRLDNGIREMSRDPGLPVELEAFTSYGRSLWRRPLVNHDHCFGNANNVPINVFDLDGDGRAEVIAAVQEDGRVHLAVLDGMTGRVLRKTPWREMVSDFAKSSTRVHMSVAYLDGRTPAIVTQTGLYENEILDAYTADLKHLWTYESLAETNGSGSHHVDIADVDGDGRDEVFNGTMLLNPDGTMRWSIYRQHPDIVSVARFLPGLQGRQVFYAVESSIHAGAYLVDAANGRVIWKVNREDDPRWTHAHTGWAADVWEDSPGVEMMTNRDGHHQEQCVLFAADGTVLADPFERGWRPVNWTGGAARDLISGNGTRLSSFDGKEVRTVDIPPPNESGGGSCRMVADLVGDFRDEIVCIASADDGGPVILVYTNPSHAQRRETTRTGSREYRIWLAHNMGGGYPSYYEWQAPE